ncbi:MAG: SlyX family protein [Gammaproteobacteria bacterium]|nr:SlyX family protein [Gammaproteobacteria bacterium]
MILSWLELRAHAEDYMEDRVNELESRIAFLDDTVQELNDVIARQQLLLTKIENDMKTVKSHLNTLAAMASGQGTNEIPPPHY